MTPEQMYKRANELIDLIGATANHDARQAALSDLRTLVQMLADSADSWKMRFEREERRR